MSDAERVVMLLDELKKPDSGSGLYKVLQYYETIKDLPERVGVCHDLAVAIMCDLRVRGTAKGWVWCRGDVDGGVSHSWVEYDGIGVDMGDDHRLRLWPTSAPPFQKDGAVEVRDAEQTWMWAEEQAPPG